MTDLLADEFVELCEALTGVTPISRRLAISILQRTRCRCPDEHVTMLVEAFSADGIPGIQRNPEVLKLAKEITYCLYTGHFRKGAVLPGANVADRPIPEDYFEAVVWHVIQAHPPGLSGGYFAHWHYPPEDVSGS